MIKAAFLAFGGQLRTTSAEDFHKRERGGGRGRERGERERERERERGRERGERARERERERERLASSSAHADIKETFKQKIYCKLPSIQQKCHC